MKKFMAILLTMVLCISTALGADTSSYPSKPITIIAPYPPGGATDMIARSLAQHLQTVWGQPVIVENRPGNSGMIGASQVARSPADGYTLLVGSQALYSVNPLLYSNIPYNATEDFTPIAQLAQLPSYFVVPEDLPVSSFQEFVEYVRERPGAISYGSAGAGTAQHIFMEMLKIATGMDMAHIPYRGSSPAVMDLVGGRVQAMIDFGPSILPFVRSGKLKALAVSTPERSAILPDVPSLHESGVKDFNAATWFAVHAPGNMDKGLAERLSVEAGKAMQGTELKTNLENMGINPTTSTPRELSKKQADELVKWKRVIDSAGITLE